jgi:hypothetical protein
MVSLMVILVQYLLDDRDGLGIIELRVVMQVFMRLLVFMAVVMLVVVMVMAMLMLRSSDTASAICTQN